MGPERQGTIAQKHVIFFDDKEQKDF